MACGFRRPQLIALEPDSPKSLSRCRGTLKALELQRPFFRGLTKHIKYSEYVEEHRKFIRYPVLREITTNMMHTNIYKKKEKKIVSVALPSNRSESPNSKGNHKVQNVANQNSYIIH